MEEFNYKGDVLNRAKWLIDRVGSVGAYSASNGVPAIRDSIASFFQGIVKPASTLNSMTP